MKTPDRPELRDKALALLSQFEAIKSIGLGGSQSTGSSDILSDLDLMIFCDKHYPDFQTRNEVYKSTDGLEPPHHGHLVSIGYEQPPLSVRFEVDSCRLDDTNCDFLWTTRDGWKAIFNAANDRIEAPEFLIAGLLYAQPLSDPDGIIRDIQLSVPEYTEQRARRKAGHYIFPAHFWLCRIGALQKAILRNDIVEYHKREGELVENLIGALFALNRTWHLHSRRLRDTTAGFHIMPNGFLTRLEDMLCRKQQFQDLPECHSELKALFGELSALANEQYENSDLPTTWPDRRQDVQQAN